MNMIKKIYSIAIIYIYSYTGIVNYTALLS